MAYPCPSRCLCAFGVPLRVFHSEFFILVKGVRGNGGGRLRFRVSGVVAFQVTCIPKPCTIVGYDPLMIVYNPASFEIPKVNNPKS